MARACGSYPQCRGFKSLLRYHNGVSPSGKATDSDSVIRRFESCYPSSSQTEMSAIFLFLGIKRDCRKRQSIFMYLFEMIFQIKEIGEFFFGKIGKFGGEIRRQK